MQREESLQCVEEHGRFLWEVGRNDVAVCVANLFPVVADVFE